ncbi:hypothetical protein BGX31_004511 [Mortierella sp. GBA43]|nr:hypothetical protein BGX31_004511 [Mortierella sp. GBA43]
MDPDDLRAQEWQSNSVSEKPKSSPRANSQCDDYWFVPTYVDRVTLRKQLDIISSETATRLEYRKEDERVELWGDYPCTQKAKESLERLASFYYDLREKQQKVSRTKGWAKPDREPTAAEKRRQLREEERLLEKQKYMGTPKIECAFVHAIKWPIDRSPLEYLGQDLRILDPLREEFKCFIWLERDRIVYVAGEVKEDTFKVMNRIKNFIFKCLRQIEERIVHVLETPSKLVQLVLDEHAPVMYISPNITNNNNNQDPLPVPNVFVRAKEIAGFGNLVDYDLQMANLDTGGSDAHHQTLTLKYTDTMTQRNIERIRMTIKDSLENIMLWNNEIKMRIRLGQICLLEYPKRQSFSTDDLDENVIQNPRLMSEVSPYFTKSPDIFRALMKKLMPPDMIDQVIQPDIQWSLGVLKKGGNSGNTNVRLEVTFRLDGNVSLWNALAQNATPMDIRVISSEKRFSWAWTVTTARRLSGDKFSPEGEFVYKLRLSEPFQLVTLSTPPDKVLYSVSLSRDSWKSRFCENPHLTTGQVPSWNYTDFVEGGESISKTMEAVDDIRAKIESLY